MQSTDTLERMESQLSVRASDRMRSLYVEYRAAKAAWDGWADVASHWGACDIPDSGHSAAYHKAVDELLLTPAETLGDLLLKVRVFDDEQVEDGWHRGREIAAAMSSDATRFYRPEPLRPVDAA